MRFKTFILTALMLIMSVSASFAISNPCCGYLDVGDVTVYNRIAAGWTPTGYYEASYYDNNPTPCTLHNTSGFYNLVYGNVRCTYVRCLYPLQCVVPYYWHVDSYSIKTSPTGDILYTFVLTPGVISEYYIYPCPSGKSTNPVVVPLFEHPYTYNSVSYQARMVTKEVYDTLEKNVYYPYLPACFSFQHQWGMGTQQDLSQRGAHKKIKGKREKGMGGYEEKNK